MKIQSLSLIIIAFVTQQIFAQNKPSQKTKDSIQQLKEVVVSAHQLFGSKFRAKNRTGSASIWTVKNYRNLISQISIGL